MRHRTPDHSPLHRGTLRHSTLRLVRPLAFAAVIGGCADVEPVEPGGAPSAPPVAEQADALTAAQTRLVSADARHLELVVEAPAARFHAVETAHGDFDRLLVDPAARPGGGDELGAPEVPVATVRFGVPVGGRIERVVVRPEGPQHIEGVRLYPIQDEVDSGEPAFAFEAERYRRPVRAVEPRSVSIARGADLSVARMRLNLVDYEPDRLRLTHYRRLRVRIELSGDCLFLGDPAPRDPLMQAVGGPMDPRLENLMNVHAMVAHACVESAPELAFSPPAPDLLIVTDPAYIGAARTLAAHKRRLGLVTHVLDTAAAGDSVDDIHDYLSDRNPPRYLLLLGDADDITPHHDADLGANCLDAVGDVFAGQPADDPGVIPEMAIGRLPARSAADAETMVQRIVDYELEPSEDDAFYSAVSISAEWEDLGGDGTMDRGYVHVAEHIGQGLEAMGVAIDRHFGTTWAATPTRWAVDDLLPPWLTSPTYDWTTSIWDLADDVVDGLSDGRLLALHRGHGAPTRWSVPRLAGADAAAVTIEDREFPFVMGINCDSGRFDREVLSDAWQCSGSPFDTTSPSFAEDFALDAAIGVFAATRITYTSTNHEIARGLFEALYPRGWFGQRFTEHADGTRTVHHVPLQPARTGAWRLGDVANRGRAAAADAGLSDTATHRQVLVYNLLGDPTVRLATAAPLPVEPFIAIDRDRVEVEINRQTLMVATLTDPETGTLLARAAAHTGRVTLPLDGIRGAVDLTVSGPGLRPAVQRLRP